MLLRSLLQVNRVINLQGINKLPGWPAMLFSSINSEIIIYHQLRLEGNRSDGVVGHHVRFTCERSAVRTRL